MINRIKKYLQGIYLEWQKVSKPDRKEVQGSTITVLVASTLLGLFIGLVDGTDLFPEWGRPLTWIFLIALPITVFFIVKSWEEQPKTNRRNITSTSNASLLSGTSNRQVIAAAAACIPFITVLVSQYVLDSQIKGFGMAFLRKLFIPT